MQIIIYFFYFFLSLHYFFMCRMESGEQGEEKLFMFLNGIELLLFAFQVEIFMLYKKDFEMMNLTDN